MDASGKNLLDPQSYGEDLFAVANRAGELSKTLCDGCGAYHFRIPASRAVGRSESLEKDRPQIVKAIGDIWKQNTQKNTPFELVIAGSADTGLVATTAHAIALQGQDALHRTHFTVIDRCPTPLWLCAEFSARHGVACSTIQGDLLTAKPSKPVDMVVMHSVLRFFSVPDRVQFLRHASGWLAPKGLLLISNSYGGQSEEQRLSREKTREESLKCVESAIREGRLVSPFSLSELGPILRQSFVESLDRDRVFFEASDVDKLAESAGLRIINFSFSSPQDSGSDKKRSPRILAVLASA
jgi:hypothetical protein